MHCVKDISILIKFSANGFLNLCHPESRLYFYCFFIPWVVFQRHFPSVTQYAAGLSGR
jgi:hypothetical protein